MRSFHCYSPGQSPLVFCWQEKDDDGRHVVVSERVKPIYPSRVKQYLASKEGKSLADKGYEIHKIEGRWTVMMPVERVNENTLRMEGQDFRYRITHEVPIDYDLWSSSVRFEFKPSDRHSFLDKEKSGWWMLRNWNMMFCLVYFLRYESIWESSKWDTGKRIKDSDTWAEKKVWEVTEFPDGDGFEFKD